MSLNVYKLFRDWRRRVAARRAAAQRDEDVPLGIG
jgi:hypothetical protein